MTTHLPHEILHVTLSLAELMAVVACVRRVYDKASLNLQMTSNDLLRRHYQGDVDRCEQLLAQLEEPGTEVLTADDVRYCRICCATDTWRLTSAQQADAARGVAALDRMFAQEGRIR